MAHASPPSYTISLEGFFIHAIIGILPDERISPQRIRISLSITYAPTSFKHFIDYCVLRDVIRAHLQEARYELLEEALEGSIACIKARFPSIAHCILAIGKCDVFADCVAEVRTQRAFV